ncbi:MAG: xylosidase [Ferruginibacter sp.]|nr:xylosidase [Ferruginibacter sp.]
MKNIVIFIGVILLQLGVFAQSKHSATSIFKSYKGLVMAGYQGWFNAPGDGAKRGWNHYKGRGKFEPGYCKIDMWPDVSEYKTTYKTPFLLADGKPAELFSSYDASSVNLHFKWMKDYGIDGVFIQRFVTNLKSRTGADHNNTVLSNAIHAAEKYKRAISVMYDLSGMSDKDCELIISDWKFLVDSLKVTSRGHKQSYLYHNNKPLVVLWGVGFPGRDYTTRSVERVIDFLRDDAAYGGCSIMLGVPTYWRTLGKDTDKDPYLHTVLRKADIVQPWLVGRYNERTYPAFKQNIADDLAWCKQNKLGYVPVIFPGFSWHNMNPGSAFDQTPRNKGQFFWKQLYGALDIGVDMLYIAMFDEVDEGTAIFKIDQHPPVGDSRFVTFEEGIPSDYYLYLTGIAGKMLRKKIPLKQDIPLPASKKK